MQSSDRSGFVYVIQDGAGLCKIGRTRNLDKRIRALSTASSSELRLVAYWQCDDAAEHEATKHEFWSDCRVRGEWFRIPDDVLAAWKGSHGQRIPRESDEDAWNALMLTEAAFDRYERDHAKKTPDARNSAPGEDGSWWTATHSQVIHCPKCDRDTKDTPAVVRYVEAADFGGCQKREYPMWPRLGWAVWRQCEHCSWMDWKSEYRTLAQIVGWKVGPWRPMP